MIYFNLNPTICDQAFLSVFRGGRNRERLIVNVCASNPFTVRVCGFTQGMYFICRSSHWYSIPCGDDPIGPELVTFLRVFSMGEGMNVDANYCTEGCENGMWQNQRKYCLKKKLWRAGYEWSEELRNVSKLHFQFSFVISFLSGGNYHLIEWSAINRAVK